MNKSLKIAFLLPGASLPYALILAVSVLLFWHEAIDALFLGNGLLYLGVFVSYVLISAAFTFALFVVALKNKWDPLFLAKTAMLIKLVQIPAYVVIYVAGVFMAITVFTIPFVLVFVVVDAISVFLSGLPVIASTVNVSREGKRPLKSSVWVILLQFVFCLDVVAACVYYVRLKKSITAEQ